MKWITCNSCEEEFRVISDTGPSVDYCPFCGSDIEFVDEDDSDSEYYYEE